MADSRLKTIIEWIAWGSKQLTEAGRENARQEAEILLSCSIHIPFKHLLTRLREEVPLSVSDCYQKLVQKRGENYPLQYLTGIQEFMSLEFEVNEAVLIPRWDTEILVQAALDILRKLEQPRVIDIGTGSGAIVVSLAKYHDQGIFFAVDISLDALRVAERNARRHGVGEKIVFLSGDLLGPILNATAYQDGKFDLVISNPPYIPQEEIAKLPEDVQKEPHLALDGGADGLDCYRALLSQAPRVLKSEGTVLLEIGFDQAKDVGEICLANGLQDIRVFQDYGQRDRIISACFKG